MATIGTFKKAGNNEFTGEIVTLSVQTKNVRIVPEARATGENAPSHRVFVGRAEIGAAWRSEEHTSELQSLMRNSYAVFCLQKKKHTHDISSELYTHTTK